jgi:hypothetical protein
MAATDSLANLPPALDFASLRQEGIRQLERLAGPGWTDFNVHDPGITILEQACYALTDLGYRAGHELPDLLASAGDATLSSLHTPAQILPTNPVTLTDLRKLVIDVPGVQNAWIDIVDEPAARFDAEKAEISPLAADEGNPSAPSLSPNISDLRLRGLLRVRIEKPDPTIFPGGGDIVAEAARRLHRCRGLGQDFDAIQVLEQQSVRLAATLEIAAVDDAATLLAAVCQRIAAYLSPAVPFHTLAAMLARGRRVDEIFEGPLLEQGFIDADDLAQVERRGDLRISDLIQAIMGVPGVVAVKNLQFLDGDADRLQASRDWVRQLDADKTAWFDLDQSRIHLEKNGLRIAGDIKDQAKALYKLAVAAARPARSPAAERDLRPTPGRDRRVASVQAIGQQFPVTYGVGAAGLPASASPERQALAKQLSAYLMFFDQLLANQFAQLANAARLFSFHDDTSDSYFSQVLDDDGVPGLAAIRRSDLPEHRRLLQQLTEDPTASGVPPGARRRNRFLDHLLARYGEQFHDYALMQSGAAAGPDREAQLASDKRAFLRDYSRIGHDRGTAFNLLEPADADNCSGLELALRRKLGSTQDDERFHLVEHILLRPLPGDRWQQSPLLRGAAASDPYSLQITLVFPDWPARYRNRLFVEQTVRDETPAHVCAQLRWLAPAPMAEFAAAHAVWLQRWRDHRRAELGL